MEKQGTHHLGLIAANVLSMVLMLVCLIGFFVRVAAGDVVNTDNVWKLDFRSASDGFVKEHTMTIEDADTQQLYADISCGTVPEGATLVLWLVQGDLVKSIDVTNLSEPLEYPLNEFENGKVYVRLQINGVKNTVSEICIR